MSKMGDFGAHQAGGKCAAVMRDKEEQSARLQQCKCIPAIFTGSQTCSIT